MALKIDRFQVKNQERGRAKVLGRFDVNLGYITIKGYELVEFNGNVFAAVPHNLWKADDGSGYKKYNYIDYNGNKGKELERRILDMAKEEYKRRTSTPQQNAGGFGGSNEQSDPFGYDDADDLPF